MDENHTPFKNDPYFLRARTAVIVLFALLFLYGAFYSPPSGYPAETIFEIEEGKTVSGALALMEEENIIRFRLPIRLAVLIAGNKVVAGDYFLESPEGGISLTRRISSGDHRIETARITLPEGTSVSEMAEIFEDELPEFSREEFFGLAEEGYLFPDTYNFLINDEAEDVVRRLRATFDLRTKKLKDEAQIVGRGFNEVVTMASILEEEGNDRESRELISGILWKRLEIGMPLQVDAPFVYILGKGTFELDAEDLDIDSPYNTYRNRGLPPTPITNPGLESLETALFPKESSYLYYLSDREGNFHYADDFEKHKENKERYLR